MGLTGRLINDRYVTRRSYYQEVNRMKHFASVSKNLATVSVPARAETESKYQPPAGEGNQKSGTGTYDKSGAGLLG